MQTVSGSARDSRMDSQRLPPDSRRSLILAEDSLFRAAGNSDE